MRPDRVSLFSSPPRFALATIVLLSVGCSSGGNALPPTAPSNPLPDCPPSPNCERVSKGYPVPADRLYKYAQDALDALGPVRLQAQPGSLRAAAVYRVALVFKDDVDVAITERSQGSMLHVRSASRTGYSDLGVNRRRVQRLLSTVTEAVSTQAASQ